MSTQRSLYVDPEDWHHLRVLALGSNTTASAIVAQLVHDYVLAHPLPTATVSPLRTKPLTTHEILSRVNRGREK
jgi:hypothetical protein